MKKNGLVRLYLLFARDIVHLERCTISGRTSKRKGIDGLFSLTDLRNSIENALNSSNTISHFCISKRSRN